MVAWLSLFTGQSQLSPLTAPRTVRVEENTFGDPAWVAVGGRKVNVRLIVDEYEVDSVRGCGKRSRWASAWLVELESGEHWYLLRDDDLTVAWLGERWASASVPA